MCIVHEFFLCWEWDKVFPFFSTVSSVAIWSKYNFLIFCLDKRATIFSFSISFFPSFPHTRTCLDTMQWARLCCGARNQWKSSYFHRLLFRIPPAPLLFSSTVNTALWSFWVGVLDRKKKISQAELLQQWWRCCCGFGGCGSAIVASASVISFKGFI